MYYLQRNSEKFWEEVDQYTFENHDKAIATNGTPRYNGNWVRILDGHITIEAKNLSLQEMAQVYRFCGGDDRGISLPVSPGGYLRKPEYIKFCIRKRMILREMSCGVNFPARTETKPRSEPANQLGTE